MMLNAKIQAAVDLQKEFQSIVEANTDSFSKQMVNDMKKCVQKAQKEHGVQMTKEKVIIDNLQYSEKWFISAYQKLKQACGMQALNDVDFKEFDQILECIKDPKQLEEVLQIVNSDCIISSNIDHLMLTNQVTSNLNLQKSKSTQSQGQKEPSKNQLVCAAKNLQQSLLRCQWMVQAQQLLGIGRFSNVSENELFRQENTSSEQLAQLKTKDIVKVCHLTKQIDQLCLRPLIEGKQSSQEENEYSQVIYHMRQLSHFARDYKRLYGSPIDSSVPQSSDNQFERISQIINSCENIAQHVLKNQGTNQQTENQDEQIIDESDEKIQELMKQGLQKAVNQLDRVINDINNLQTKRKELNIVNQYVLECDSLESIFEQAKAQVKFSREFNHMKLQNAPNFKLTIKQSLELLEQAQKFKGITKDSHIVKKLEQNIQKYDKFKRDYIEYTRFKKRQKYELLQYDEEQKIELQKIEQNQKENQKIPLPQGFSRDQNEHRFTYDFVNNLITNSEEIDIDISNEYKESKNPATINSGQQKRFEINSLKNDIYQYDEFKKSFINVIEILEKEIFEKQTTQSIQDIKSKGLEDKFHRMRIEITRLPVYDRTTYKRIQAFVWIFNAYELLETGHIDKDSPFHQEVDNRGVGSSNTIQNSGEISHNYMSVKQWKDFIKYHSSFLNTLPELKSHSIVHQLIYQVQAAQELIEDVKDQKLLAQKMTAIFNKGNEYYKYSEQYHDFDQEWGNNSKGKDYYLQQSQKQKQWEQYQNNKIKDKIFEQSNYLNNKQGVVGPNIPKDRLLTYFKKKLNYHEFTEKRRSAEEIKINLSDELKILNKWINEYDDLVKFKQPSISTYIKENLTKQLDLLENKQDGQTNEENKIDSKEGEAIENEKKENKEMKPKKIVPVSQFQNTNAAIFSYQPLFESYQYDKLKQFAKQVFISPIYNWQLFAILKKRLETAHEIRQDLKFISKDQLEGGTGGTYQYGQNQVQKRIKISISRIEPFIAQYYQNCRVQGLPEIDKVILSAEHSKLILKQITSQIKNSVNIENNQEMMIQEKKEYLDKLKELYHQLEFDFENKEITIRQKIWLLETNLLKTSADQLESNDILSSEIETKSYKIDFDEYQILDREYGKLKLKKTIGLTDENVKWFTGFREKINLIVSKLSKVQNDQELELVKDEIKQNSIYSFIDFQQKIEDKNAKFSMSRTNEDILKEASEIQSQNHESQNQSQSPSSSSQVCSQTKINEPPIISPQKLGLQKESSQNKESSGNSSSSSSNSSSGSSDSESSSEDSSAPPNKKESEDASISSSGSSGSGSDSSSLEDMSSSSISQKNYKRKTKPNEVADVIYFSKKNNCYKKITARQMAIREKKLAAKKRAKEGGGGEEETKQESQSREENESERREKKREEKRKIKRQRKRVQQEYEKQKQLERLKRLEAFKRKGQYKDNDSANKNKEIQMSNIKSQANIYDEKVFSDIQQQFLHKIRNESKFKIQKQIAQLKNQFDLTKLENPSIRESVNQLEQKVFLITQEKISDAYNTKIETVQRNIKYIQFSGSLMQPTQVLPTLTPQQELYKEMGMMIFVKKQLNLFKLLLNHQKFREYTSEKIQQIRKKKKDQQGGNEQKGQTAQQNYLDQLQESNFDVEKIAEETSQQNNQIIAASNHEEKKSKQKSVEKKSNKKQVPQTYVNSDGEEEDIFSEESNPAIFSSDDGVSGPSGSTIKPSKEQAHQAKMPGIQSTRKQQISLQNSLLGQIYESHKSTEYYDPLNMDSQSKEQKKMPVIRYNPLQVLTLNNPSSANSNQKGDSFSGNQINSQQDQVMLGTANEEPSQENQQANQDFSILYDPMNKKSALFKIDGNKGKLVKPIREELNVAQPGQLLRVWRGKLDLMAHFNKPSNPKKKYSQTIHVDFFTNQDIKLYQAIPDWPQCIMNNKKSKQGSLPLRGQTNLSEIMKHFTILKKEKKNILYGWMTVATSPDGDEDYEQLNYDRYTNHFQDLTSKQKSSLFILYDQVKAVSNPQSAQANLTEIKEVYVYILPIYDQATQHFCSQVGINPPEDHIISNTHMFAYMINIKHHNYSMTQKIRISKSGKPSLNPEVLRELPGPMTMEAQFNIEAQEAIQQDQQNIAQIQEMIKIEQQQQQQHMDQQVLQNQQQIDYYQGGIPQNQQEQPGPLIPLLGSPTAAGNLTEEQQIDLMIQNLKASNAGYDEIMQALLPYIKQKNIQKRSEQKLMHFIQELIEQRKQQDARQQIMQQQNMLLSQAGLQQVKQEDDPMTGMQGMAPQGIMNTPGGGIQGQQDAGGYVSTEQMGQNGNYQQQYIIPNDYMNYDQQQQQPQGQMTYQQQMNQMNQMQQYPNIYQQQDQNHFQQQQQDQSQFQQQPQQQNMDHQQQQQNPMLSAQDIQKLIQLQEMGQLSEHQQLLLQQQIQNLQQQQQQQQQQQHQVLGGLQQQNQQQQQNEQGPNQNDNQMNSQQNRYYQ